jgi:hypothetical protein
VRIHGLNVVLIVHLPLFNFVTDGDASVRPKVHITGWSAILRSPYQLASLTKGVCKGGRRRSGSSSARTLSWLTLLPFFIPVFIIVITISYILMPCCTYCYNSLLFSAIQLHLGSVWNGVKRLTNKIFAVDDRCHLAVPIIAMNWNYIITVIYFFYCFPLWCWIYASFLNPECAFVPVLATQYWPV